MTLETIEQIAAADRLQGASGELQEIAQAYLSLHYAVKEYLAAKSKLDSVQDYEGNNYRWRNMEHLRELAKANFEWVHSFLKLRDTFNDPQK